MDLHLLVVINQCYALCLDIPPNPHAVIRWHFFRGDCIQSVYLTHATMLGLRMLGLRMGD